MTDGEHLWEIDHPYYCERGNSFVPETEHENEAHLAFESWEEFRDFDASSEADHPHRNLVYRWDWRTPDDEHYEQPEGLPRPDKLMLYMVQQRKAFNLSYEIDVRKEDEDEVKEWLAERAEIVRSMWAPLLNEALQTIPEFSHISELLLDADEQLAEFDKVAGRKIAARDSEGYNAELGKQTRLIAGLNDEVDKFRDAGGDVPEEIALLVAHHSGQAKLAVSEGRDYDYINFTPRGARNGDLNDLQRLAERYGPESPITES